MKKHLLLILGLAFGLILLAGCNSPMNSATDKVKDDTKINDKAPQDLSNREPDRTADGEPSKYETLNNFAGVTMTVKKGSASADGLTVTVENKSSSKCIYGEDFDLEKQLNGRWYKVPVTIKGNYAFTDIGFELASGESREWKVDWKWLYGSLASGDYRIVKGILDFRGTGDYDQYYLAAEFNVL